ncbi:multidrug efflux protein [Mangrovimicrobium sediminis]|uniref:Multidrug efflux protein n=1 Tax=Mangrovimicrobium sediminis TaxID=2562682 RepID=A0A4Z0LXA2_9GAMM|nr:efflux RND transporter permease subunit [Haliea sp. SAOS-164]TGD71911.1 multidrug efflux protein [Haliea sp. SAOS-164]
MNFTDIFIRRPVLAIVVSCLLLVLGTASIFNVSVREYPEVETSVVQVFTSYPGASAATVQGFVTDPLQERIVTARGVDYMTSNSTAGSSNITVHVRLGENSTEVLNEVIAKVNEAAFDLPREVEDPVVSSSFGGDAMMYIAFYSKQMTTYQITDYLERAVRPELATLPGMGQAQIFKRKLAMRVWLDPVRMAARGVTANDVREAIQRDNFIAPAGATEGNLVRVTVDADTTLETTDDFAELVVRQVDDERVRLGDVADIELDAENSQLKSLSSGRDTVFLALSPAPGANPLEVSKAVHEAVPRIAADLPADMELVLDWDGSIYIDEALAEVSRTLLEAAVIVVLVIFLFLGSARVVLIPLAAIPLSLIGVVFLIMALGFSLNLLTMLAMIIAIGLVVDDAIVVVENVHRHIEGGATPMEAALRGAREVALPVVLMTLTLVAVYAPISFIGGLTGALFSEFALTLAGAVLVSGVVALTLSPMMCSRVLQDVEHQGRFATWLDHRFEALIAAYQRLLRLCLANRGAVLLLAASLLASLPVLFSLAQRELAPEEDAGGFMIIGSAPPQANLKYLDHYLAQIVDIWKTMPDIQRSWQVIADGDNFGGVMLNPWSERERSQADIQAEMQQKLGQIAGMEMFTFNGAALPGAEAGLPVSFVVASTSDYQRVYEVGEQLLQRARESGLFAFITQTLDYNRPEIQVKIDRERAARLGISMQDIGLTLATMLGEAEVNRFTLSGRSYKVIPQAGKDFRLTPEELEKYYVRTSSDELVPMSSVISLATRVEPNALTQYQQLNSTTIQGMMMPPNSLGTGLEFLETQLQEIAPTGFRAGYSGASRQFTQESAAFPILFGLSLVLIFLMLAAQFNSFRDPLVVLVTVPLSIFGAVVPLALGFATLNIYTQVGLLTLIGLISKHGILIVEFANKLAEDGMERREAVLQAASMRLRPILMTTFATVLGVWPLVIASGAGAASRFSIGLTITCGMLVGTLFTLFVVPVFYLPFRRRAEQAQAASDPSPDPATTG